MSRPVGSASAHLGWETFAKYLEGGRVDRIPVPGSPYLEYFHAEGGNRIGLRLEIKPDDELPGSPLTAVRAIRVHDHHRHLLEISTAERTLFRDFHDLAGAVVDRVRLEGVSPLRAFGLTVRSWEALLARPRGMGLEQRIGLIGELYVLEQLAASRGWPTAVEAWKATAGEEHDFGLETADLEVKTTTAERRTHRISSLTQLIPADGRALWLVSLQFTRGGRGGRTTAEWVAAAVAAVTAQSPHVLSGLKAKLVERGWLPSFADLPDDRWVRRSEPIAFAVAGSFPRLTPDVLDALPPSIRERIGDIGYRVDLTGLEPKTPLADVLGHPGQGVTG